MSTEIAQELQIKRLQKFIWTYAQEMSADIGKNIIHDAIEECIIYDDDLHELP